LVVIHTLSGAALLVLISTVLGDRGKVPLYISLNVRAREPEDPWQVKRYMLADAVQVSYASVVFVWLAALDHLCVCVFRPEYERYLAKGQNPFRWAEYTVSFSTMSVLICILCGMIDVWQLFAAVLCSVTCIACGWLSELAAGDTSLRTLLYNLGFIPFMLLWTMKFGVFIAQVQMQGSSVPGFVWGIMFALFTLELLFGVIPRLTCSYVNKESWFCVLSLVAKQMLLWITFGGLMSMREPTLQSP
jgi:hypothetical protein